MHVVGNFFNSAVLKSWILYHLQSQIRATLTVPRFLNRIRLRSPWGSFTYHTVILHHCQNMNAIMYFMCTVFTLCNYFITWYFVDCYVFSTFSSAATVILIFYRNGQKKTSQIGYKPNDLPVNCKMHLM